MFGRTKPVVFERYGKQRSRWRLPRWLVLLSLGMAVGSGGTVYVQERFLPPRLSAQASTALRSAFAQADSDRLRLQAELANTDQKLQAALAEKKRQDDELAAPRAASQRLRDELAAAIDAFPPDPRGSLVEVRGARLTAQVGKLAYAVVLTRERAIGQPLAALMQLSVVGANARGSETSVSLGRVELSIDKQQVVRGSLPLPEGFKPRQATVQLLDRAGVKPLGMRVLRVQ